MASYTTNLNLKKPAGSENVAIGDINNNMDAIDTAYGTMSAEIDKKLNNVTQAGSANNTYTVNLSANYRGILIATRAGGTGGLYFVGTNASKVASYAEGIAISGLTITTGTGSIEIALTSNTYLSMLNLSGEASFA